MSHSLKRLLHSVPILREVAEFRRRKRRQQRQERKRLERFYCLGRTCQIRRLDRLYEKYFGCKKDGIFVEFGAYDGEFASNTSGLADLGWQGYYIEPVPEYYQKCLRRHQKNPNTKVENLAIGAQPGKVKIEVSSAHSHVRLEGTQNEGKHIEIEQNTLESFLQNNHIKNGFDLLVVDVEGYEWQALKNFNITSWKPKMVIVEIHDQLPDNTIEENRMFLKLAEYFEKAGYRVVYKDFTNTIYVEKGLIEQLMQNPKSTEKQNYA